MLSGILSDADRLRRLRRSPTQRSPRWSSTSCSRRCSRRTRALLDVDTCAILLLDEERHELVAHAAVGLEEELEQKVPHPGRQGLRRAGRRELRPVVLHRRRARRRDQPAPAPEGDREARACRSSSTARPYRRPPRRHAQRRAFTARRSTCSSSPPTARRSRSPALAYEAERRPACASSTSSRSSTPASRHLELDALLDELLDRIREILAADTCAVLLLDPAGRELVARAAVGIEEEVEQGVRIPLGKGFAGRIAAEAEADRPRRRRPRRRPQPAAPREGDQVPARRPARRARARDRRPPRRHADPRGRSRATTRSCSSSSPSGWRSRSRRRASTTRWSPWTS